MNSLPKTVTRQGRDCDFDPGPSAPESSTLTTRLDYRATRASTVGYVGAKISQVSPSSIVTASGLLKVVFVMYAVKLKTTDRRLVNLRDKLYGPGADGDCCYLGP